VSGYTTRLSLPSGVNRVERFEYGGGTLVDELVGALEGSSSPHIVFLHGWGANRESLRGIGALFQNAFTVHLIDLPGFGDAPVPPADWDSAKYADLVQRHLSTYGSRSILLVGHSFGARVSIRLAARRLPQVRAVVLMAAPGLPAAPYSRVRIRRSAIRVLRRALYLLRPLTGPAAVDWHTRRFGSTDYLSSGALRPVFVRIVSENYTEDAKLVNCPVLLLWGAEDRETPIWLARRYKALMDGHATLDVLPHKDHHLYIGTGAHLCAFKIRSWLEAHGDR
jgi:pimeloyl-ACP methyl ester carboxylesterase